MEPIDFETNHHLEAILLLDQEKWMKHALV